MFQTSDTSEPWIDDVASCTLPERKGAVELMDKIGPKDLAPLKVKVPSVEEPKLEDLPVSPPDLSSPTTPNVNVATGDLKSASFEPVELKGFAPDLAPPKIPSVPQVPGGLAPPKMPAMPDVPQMPGGPASPTLPSVPKPAVPDVNAIPEMLDSPALTKDASIPLAAALVEFRLETRNTLEGALDGIDWHVNSFSLDEDLSEPFELQLEIQSSTKQADPTVLLGADAILSISRAFEESPLTRHICGVVRRVAHLDIDPDALHMRLEIVPAFAILKQQKYFRIFQDKTAKEILAEVLGGELGQYRRTADLSALGPDDKYPKREYCVQFGESDFAFCSRLMEEEGIAYYFVSAEDGHEVLTLADDNKSYVRIETLGGAPTSIFYRQGEMSEFESLSSFNRRSSTIATGYLGKDWDWAEPCVRSALHPSEDLPVDARSRVRMEQSLHEIAHYEYKGLKFAKNDATRQGELEGRLQRVRENVYFGTGFVTQFQPGMTFQLVGHRQVGFDGEYLITRVLHESGADSGEKGSSYENSFECIPLAVPYVPERVHPKPRIHGLQTAKVIGPAGEEVHTDEHGRINVQFYWDNHWEDPEVNRTCWIRVRQTWAHNGWGDQLIPYIGMEAVVSFLNGDPDRPLAIGTVYNGENRPPFELPAGKMTSGRKTIRGNEMSINDTAGAEKVFINATKDLSEVVANDHSTTVTVNQSNSVGGNQTNTVTGDQTESIDGKQTATIKGDQSITISAGSRSLDVAAGNETITVKGKRSITVQGGEQHFDVTGVHRVTTSDKVIVECPSEILLRAGSSWIQMTPGKIVLDSGAGTQIVLDGKLHAEASGKGMLDITGDVGLVGVDKTGFETHGAAARVWSSTGSQVLVETPVEASASGGGVVHIATGVDLSGDKVQAKAPEIKCEGAASTLLLDANAALEGTSVTVKGQAEALLAGPAASVKCDAILAATAPTTNIG